MADAPRDANNITSKLAVLNTDTVQGTTLVPISINSVSGAIRVAQGATISFTMVPVDPKDKNYANCWLFEGVDGLTYPAVADADGKVLLDFA
jgi:hypothetical protein